MRFSNILALGLFSVVGAHPGHEEPEHELIAKRESNVLARRGLASCAEKLQERGLNDRAKYRREAAVLKHRRSLHKRDTTSVLDKSHLSSLGVTPASNNADIFSTSNTCFVAASGEVGPYWVKGEYIRSNLQEDQPGVPIIIEAQFLDVETCEPLTEAYWDVWNCNSTGVYSGVVETGNGNSDDLSNINATFLRGIQKTDSDGVVTFKSVFPGHYSGRATHHHMIVHTNVTLEQNGTLSGGSEPYIGQLFWDQDIITQVEATYPYNTNNITITTNAEDRVFATETTDTDYDPVFNYVMLGSDLSDGLFGWVTVGVNLSATTDPAYSFELTSAGGVAASGGSDSVDGGSAMGGGNSTGNGTMGAMPSGSMSGGMPSGSMSGMMPSGSMSGAAPSGSGSAAAAVASGTGKAIASGSAAAVTGVSGKAASAAFGTDAAVEARNTNTCACSASAASY